MSCDWREIIGSPIQSESDTDSGVGGDVVLGTAPPKLRCHLEITLTHPQTSGWLKMTSVKQINFYNKVFYAIKNTCGIPLTTEMHTEFHKNGLVHAHACIQYEMTKGFSVNGMILDMVRAYIEFLPKRYSVIQMGCLKEDKHYYQSAPIKISYFNDNENPQRLEEWIKYIRKDLDDGLATLAH